MPTNDNLTSGFRLFILTALVCVAAWSSPLWGQKPPNLVLILADDLGYGDLGCYGHPRAKTPVLDQLAREGVRFTQHYANGPECSPTRTALLTGRYQQRSKGLECAIGTGNVGRYDEAIALAERRQLGLPARQSVLPQRLREQGYRCGIFGKWHLGYEPQFNPMNHGWDAFFGYLGGNVHYFNHRETSPLHVLFRGRLPVYRDGYMSDIITTDAIEFIQASQSRPFFCYVSHECPHFPFQGPGDRDKVVTADNWTEKDPDAYVAMLEDLDAQVGKLLQAITDANLRERTLVVFVSDNGGFAGAAHMGPLRGAKSSTLEGGIRVPCIAHWPGTLQPQTTHQTSITFDLTRSFLQLAGASTEDTEGYDIIKHLRESRGDRERTLFWRGRRGDRTWAAVRHGDLKWVRKVEGGQQESWLYNLRDDIGETRDLTQSQPQSVAALRQQLADWEADVDRHRLAP